MHVYTGGRNILNDVLRQFQSQISVHVLQLHDPRHLALACRDQLIAADPVADLTRYSEDNLVAGGGGQRLLRDGPLSAGTTNRYYRPQANAAHGRFHDGQYVQFDRVSNPHSGMSCISQSQTMLLRKHNLPTKGLIGPLETAATLTVLKQFPVLKPVIKQRNFLWVEHSRPSYKGYLNLFPRCSPAATSPEQP